jgi:competence protein ComEA
VDAWLDAHRVSLSLAIAVCALFGGAVFLSGRGAEQPLVIATPGLAGQLGGPRAYVSGEVARPGVYTFVPGDRVEQLIALAGGFTAAADVDSVNLALRLKDEQQVHVPSLEATGAASGSSSSAKLVNLNSATVPELETLPGIGSALAQRIVDHRTQVGPYSEVEDLRTLRLVPDSTFEKIRPLVTVR